ncbi:hypothetical protein CSAL01_05162 [Colletotrichum salicis]|uniref:Uncharacterized protein n=1 Tax=Colletotrichum salicis TaxID=1209931 RepID=A0A135V7J2_9PEZI|nr:hypothetical protein CSAL01_05162 [Colletotrichum salicis]
MRRYPSAGYADKTSKLQPAHTGIESFPQRRIEVRTPEPLLPNLAPEHQAPEAVQSTIQNINAVEASQMGRQVARSDGRGHHTSHMSARADINPFLVEGSPCMPDGSRYRERLSYLTHEVARLQAEIVPRVQTSDHRTRLSRSCRETNVFAKLSTSAQGILFPITIMAEGSLHSWDMISLLKYNRENDILVRLDPDSLRLLFSVIIQVCHKNLAWKGIFPTLTKWIRTMNTGDTLKAHLRENARDANALAEAAAKSLKKYRCGYYTDWQPRNPTPQPWCEQIIDLYASQEVAISHAAASSLLHAIVETAPVQTARTLVVTTQHA